MNRLARAAMFAASLAAFAAGACRFALAGPLPPSLTSFGASHTMMAAPALLVGQSAGDPLLLGAPQSFASSLALSPQMALDTGLDLDIGQRFTDFDSAPSPFQSSVTMPYLGLANGGRYAGFTLLAAHDLNLRAGASIRSDRLDSFTFDPSETLGLPLAFSPSQTRSLLADVSWAPSDWAGLSMNAITSTRSGVPEDIESDALDIAGKAQTSAIGMSAHMGLGNGWETSLSYAEGFTQLDLKADHSAIQDHSYAIAIAKRGVFGDDSVGFALSRPPASMLSNFSSLNSSDDLPPLLIAGNQGTAQETDFQLGYVTSFLGGKLALQTNAAYQMNFQGQNGANAVSLLSRAKIKF